MSKKRRDYSDVKKKKGVFTIYIYREIKSTFDIDYIF